LPLLVEDDETTRKEPDEKEMDSDVDGYIN
jgi:hypothetical protein